MYVPCAHPERCSAAPAEAFLKHWVFRAFPSAFLSTLSCTVRSAPLYASGAILPKLGSCTPPCCSYCSASAAQYDEQHQYCGCTWPMAPLRELISWGTCQMLHVHPAKHSHTRWAAPGACGQSHLANGAIEGAHLLGNLADARHQELRHLLRGLRQAVYEELSCRCICACAHRGAALEGLQHTPLALSDHRLAHLIGARCNILFCQVKRRHFCRRETFLDSFSKS